MSTERDGVYFRACNLCEAICGLKITVENGAITDLRGDQDDPLSRGAICPKATALIDLHSDPNRLRVPHRRVGNRFEPIAWDEAFDHVASRLRDIDDRLGEDSIATYLGNPTVHNSGSLLSSSGFLRLLRTRNRFSATSVDQLPHHVAATHMFGHPMLLPVPDVDRTDFFLIMGANPLVSNGSIMTAPGMRERLRAIGDRGGRVVVIDPRRNETAKAAHEHHFVRPGADAFVLLALIHVIFEERRERLGRLADCYDGLAQLREIAARFSPERVCAHTGIAAEMLRSLARAFSAAPRAVAYGRVGLSTQAFGGLCQWLVNVLNAVTGNLDEPGGAMWPAPAYDMLLGSNPGDIHEGRWQSRVRKYPEFNGELPVATLLDEMETPGEGQVRALVTVAGNPVLSTPNGARLAEALAQLDFMVSIDPYINETTRHAHVILPPATGLETDHYDVVFHHFAVRNTARMNRAVFEIDSTQRYDWQIFSELALRLRGKNLTHPNERLEAGLRQGPRATSIDALLSHPHGIDYGPMEPCMPQRLLTAKGRIDLVPEAFGADVDRLEAQLDRPRPEFVLIGRRSLRTNNSWMNDLKRLNRGADPCVLLMNDEDARDRGVESGAKIELTTQTGSISVKVEPTPDLMRGVVCLPHGFARANYNEIIGDDVDALTGNAALNGVPVRVTATSVTLSLSLSP
jgi:anaerobic selenocysteine-containing dehydrogenase